MWKICISSQDAAVAEDCEADLLDAYFDFRPKSSAALPTLQSRFEAKVTEALLAAQRTLLQPGAPAPWRGVLRCLSLLQGGLALSRGAMAVPHALRGVGNRHRLQLRINVRTGPAAKLKELGTLDLDVHPLETVRSVRLKVWRHFGAPECGPQCVLLSAPAVPGRVASGVLNDDALTLGRLGFAPHAAAGDACLTAFCVPHLPSQSAGVTTDAMLVAPAPGMSHLGDSMASSNALFNVLFNLLDLVRAKTGGGGTEAAAAAAAAWELLLALPTQRDAPSDIARCARGELSWATLLGNQSWHRNVYVLQVTGVPVSTKFKKKNTNHKKNDHRGGVVDQSSFNTSCLVRRWWITC
jgi:hypothetical protein